MTPPRASHSQLTPLRAHMLQPMPLHRLAPSTQQLYATASMDLARYDRRSPDQRPPDEMRAYLHHRLEERQRAWSPCTVAAAAIRFWRNPRLAPVAAAPPATACAQTPPQGPQARGR
jgi:hypothetical protein